MADTWIWLKRAKGGAPVLINLSNVSHMDPHTSPETHTTHLFFGVDDYAYSVEVRGSAEEIVKAAALKPINGLDLGKSDQDKPAEQAKAVDTAGDRDFGVS